MPVRKPIAADVPKGKQGADAIPANYVFITATEQGKAQNSAKQRSHVMQNYLKTKADKGKSATGAHRRQSPSLASGKMSFRLGRKGLERRYPYWYGKKPLEEPVPPSNLHDSISSDLKPKQSSDARDSDSLALGSRRRDEALSQDETQGLVRLSTSPNFLFGIARIDPFEVLPIRLSPWDEVLLSRFSHIEKWPWCPINGQSLWAPFALSDELVFHVTMYSWGKAFMNRFVGSKPSSWAKDHQGIMHHKLSTIQLINARISDPIQAIKDETIGAVAALTSIEIMIGTPEDAAKHMEGLRMLVAMRGGFSTFVSALQLLIQRLLSWTDLVYSELFGTSLSFPAAEIWDVSWQALERSSVLGSPLGISPVELRAAGIAHHEVIDILHATRHLCHAEQVRPLRKLNDYERMQRGDMFHKVERRLRVIVQATMSATTDPWNVTVWRAVALATLLFVHHFLRGNPVRHRQFRVLVPQLQETLLGTKESLQKLAFASSLLFWVLSVGAVTSAETPCHDWFISKLTESCRGYSLDWQGFHALLTGFLWTGPADEERYLNVWQLVEARIQA